MRTVISVIRTALYVGFVIVIIVTMMAGLAIVGGFAGFLVGEYAPGGLAAFGEPDSGIRNAAAEHYAALGAVIGAIVGLIISPRVVRIYNEERQQHAGPGAKRRLIVLIIVLSATIGGSWLALRRPVGGLPLETRPRAEADRAIPVPTASPLLAPSQPKQPKRKSHVYGVKEVLRHKADDAYQDISVSGLLDRSACPGGDFWLVDAADENDRLCVRDENGVPDSEDGARLRRRGFLSWDSGDEDAARLYVSKPE
jgi:hypothetical protein